MEYFSESTVPQYYKDITGLTCKFCGSPYIVNETRAIVKCSNPFCTRRIAGSMKSVINTIGVKGYGIESCLTIARTKNYQSILDFFEYPPIELKEEITALITRTRRLDDAVKLMFIPEFDENASKLFSQYSCMEEFLDIFEQEGTLDFEIMSVFGTGKLYENIATIVYQYLDEFYRVDGIFGFDPEELSQISADIDICVTGEVNSEYLKSKGLTVRHRDQLINFLNDSFNQYGYRFNLKKSVTSTVSFVVCDSEDSSSSKSRAGKAKGILVTTDQLLASIANHIHKNGE